MPTCLLTSDFTYLNCIGAVGGIQKVYITEYANLSGAGSTAPTITGNIITAWTLATGKKFRTYLLDQEMGMFTKPLKNISETGAILYEPSVDFTIKSLSITNVTEIHLMAKNYLTMIILDNNGTYWVMGVDRPMKLDTASFESGTKMEDFNGQKLAFKGKELVPIYQLTASLITALTT